MEHVTEETSNPFGMRVGGRAVYGYGDVNADFHVVGDNPLVHGGAETGVPFTGSTAGDRIQSVLHAVGLAAEPYADEPDLRNTFVSYVHPRVPDDPPTDAEYHEQERFLDAELRAINAHVLLPVGDRALRYTLREHTSHAHRLPDSAAALHARQVRGRGFLVVPIEEPAEWTDGDRDALVAALDTILASDYRQTKGIPTLVG